MAQARDEAGNIWEVDAQGNPVRLVTPANAQQGRVFTLPVSPEKQREIDRQAAQDARQAERDAAADADREADNRRADRTLAIAEERAARDANGTAKQRAEWKANLGNISLLEQQLASLRQQYKDHFAGKGLQSLAESYAPSGIAPQYAVFDQTAQSMIADMAKAKGLTSQQFNTPAEQRMFFEPLLPKRGDPDEVIVSKLDYLDKMIASGRRTTEANLGIQGQQADNEVAKAAAVPDPSPPDLPPTGQGGNAPVTPWDGPNGTPADVAASGATRTERSDRLSAQVDALVNAGASEATINAVLKQQGFPAIMPGQLDAARKWMKENPGKSYFGSDITREVPLNIGQRISGSALGAGLAKYADAATAGLAGAAAGERGKGALDAMGALHPGASTLGTILGSVTGAAGLEGIAGAGLAGTAAVRFAPRIADSVYGATSGFTAADDGQGLQGALTGAVVAPIGGMVGERAMRAAGQVARGVTDPAVQYLRSQGVPLTVGQAMGGLAKGIEDKATSVPFIGDVIKNRRLEGLQAFDRAAFRQAGEPIGAAVDKIGQEGIEELLGVPGDPLRVGATGRAYDAATAGAYVPLDGQYAQDFVNVARMGEGLPDDLRGRLGLALNNRVNPINDAGAMTGETYQQAMRGLKSYKAENVKPGFEQDYRNALSAAQDALTGQMERGGGAEVASGLRSADKAYRNAKTLQDAVGRAKGGSGSGEIYTFTPSQLQGAVTRTQGKYPGAHPLQELADYGQAVLPSRIPDSGTAGRAAQMILPGVIGGSAAGGYAAGDTGGAVGGAGLGLGATLALILGGGKGAQRALTGAILSRPAAVRAVGEAIERNAQIGGGLGAGILTPLLVGSQ